MAFYPRRRRRPAIACEHCRRKIKCDRTVPCGGCIRSSLHCTFEYSNLQYNHLASAVDPTSPADLPGPGPGLDSTQLSLLDEDISAMNDMLGLPQLDDHYDFARPETSISFPQTSAEIPVGRIPDESSSAMDLLTSSRPSTSDADNNRVSITPSQRMSILSNSLSGTFKNAQGSELPRFNIGTVVPGNGHWQKEYNRLECLQFLFSSQSTTTTRRNLEKDVPHSLVRKFRDVEEATERPQVEVERPLTAVDCRCLVPHREVSDHLLGLYLGTGEFLLRILYIPTFLRDYQLYWEHPQAVDDAFVWKLLLAMAIGARFNHSSGSSASSMLQADYPAVWTTGGQRYLESRENESVDRYFDLDMIQIGCLLLVNDMNVQVGSREHTWLTPELLMSIAMRAGLHQEPSVHFPGMSQHEAELRRRLWCTILETLIQYSFDYGLPPLLSPENYDCQPPSDLDDADILDSRDRGGSTDPVRAIVSNPPNKVTQTTPTTLIAKTQTLRLRILHAVNSPGIALSYDAALCMTTELRAICAANLAHMRAAVTGPDSLAELNEFHIKLVDIYTRRFLLALHGPFVTQSRTNLSYYYTRKVRLETSALMLLFPLPDMATHCVHEIEPSATVEAEKQHLYLPLLKGTTNTVFVNAIRLATSTLCVELIDSAAENTLAPVIDKHEHLHKCIEDSMAIFDCRLQNKLPRSCRDYVFFCAAIACIDNAQRNNRNISPENAVYKGVEQGIERCSQVGKGRDERR